MCSASRHIASAGRPPRAARRPESLKGRTMGTWCSRAVASEEHHSEGHSNGRSRARWALNLDERSTPSDAVQMRDNQHSRASARHSHGLSVQDVGEGEGARRSRPTFGLRLKSDAGFQYFGAYKIDETSSRIQAPGLDTRALPYCQYPWLTGPGRFTKLDFGYPGYLTRPPTAGRCKILEQRVALK